METANEVMYPIRWIDPNGDAYQIDWRDIEEAMRRYPEGRTAPGDNINELLLIADDCVWLWSLGIGF
jgi:hypothetical protein